MGRLFSEPEKGQHSPGPSFFRSIRIVIVKIAGGANAAVMHFLDTRRSALPDYFRREIDFVVGWPDTRAKLRDQFGWLDAESAFQQSDRSRCDFEFRAFATGVHQGDRALFAIGQVERAAISHINTETDVFLIGNQAVAVGETGVLLQRRIDQGEFAAVDLFGGRKSAPNQPGVLSCFPVNMVQFGNDQFLVLRHRDARNAPDKSMWITEAAKCRKCIERELVTLQENFRSCCV